METSLLIRIRYQDECRAGVHVHVGNVRVAPFAGDTSEGRSGQPRWKTRSSPVTPSSSDHGPKFAVEAASSARTRQK